MAIYRTNVYNKGSRLRPTDQGGASEISVTFTLYAGQALAAQDLIYFANVGEGVDIITADLTIDALDSNATATIAGSLGTVPATTLKTYAAVTGQVGYNSILALTTKLGLNTGATGINIQRDAGGSAGVDGFNINPFPVFNAPVGTAAPVYVPTDLVMAIGTAAATPITLTDRNITLRCKFQYTYPDRVVIGVDNVNYPFQGNKLYSAPTSFNYNGNGPG